MLTETGTRAHFYLSVAGLTALIMFLVYVFICEHKTSISDNTMWVDAFLREGITPSQIEDLSHDDSMWYYRREATCVAYGGDFKGECRRYESYCAGGEVYGSASQQAKAVTEALKNGGEHKLCPLIYPGAE